MRVSSLPVESFTKRGGRGGLSERWRPPDSGAERRRPTARLAHFGFFYFAGMWRSPHGVANDAFFFLHLIAPRTPYTDARKGKVETRSAHGAPLHVRWKNNSGLQRLSSSWRSSPSASSADPSAYPILMFSSFFSRVAECAYDSGQQPSPSFVPLAEARDRRAEGVGEGEAKENHAGTPLSACA